jgi:hypothetical protein
VAHLLPGAERVQPMSDFMPGLESREHARRDPSSRPRGTHYPQKSALTSPTNDGRSVGIVRSRTQATEFVLFLNVIYNIFPRYIETSPQIQIF